MTGTLGIILFVITVIGVLAAPILVVIFAPGWVDGDDRFQPTVEMLRFTFPYILFISLTALAGGILNTYGKFAVPAFTPVLLNFCLIGAAIISATYFEENIIVLAWGVFAAGLAQILFQLPFIMKLRLISFPRWGWRKPGVVKIKKLMLPAIFSSSVQQINLLIDYWSASFLVGGSISWLYYADRLVEFPLGVFGIAIATVILPSLSAKYAEADPEKFRHTLDWGLRLSLLIGAPATVGLIMLAGPLLSAIFQYGDFDAEDVHMAQLALIAYSVGLLGFIYVKVLSPGYFARQNTKTPMKIAIISMVAKIIVTLIIVITMVQMSYEAPHVGLALSTALSALLQSWLLYRGLVRDGIYKPDPGWFLYLLKIGLACAVMGVVLHFGVEDVFLWAKWDVYERAFNILLWVGAGAVIYLVVLLLTGVNIKALIKHG